MLVDFRTADDAGVYRWADGPALVQTVDFFTPIVDDPYVFGQIAAANALSDVYAMGGVPRTALAITAFPKNGPPADAIRAIFRGGADMLRKAGVALLGGHTVTDPEVKFGYSVTGEVDPRSAADQRRRASRRRADPDQAARHRHHGARAEVRAARPTPSSSRAIASMKRLNDAPVCALAGLPAGAVRACTDVTGFGLAGHASEMAAASGVTLVIRTGALPVLPGAVELVMEFLPCGGRANRRHFGAIRVDDDVRAGTASHLPGPADVRRLAAGGAPRARARASRRGWRLVGVDAQAIGIVESRHAG